MGLYQITDPAGVFIRTQCEGILLPAGAVLYLSDPPSAPPGATPAQYPGYGPPVPPPAPGFTGQGWVPYSRAGAMTAMAIAAGRIRPVPGTTPLTPPPPPFPAVQPPGSTAIQSPLPGAPPTGTEYGQTRQQPGPVNLLIYRAVAGQPGLKVAVQY